jgi:hypothetical protein
MGFSPFQLRMGCSPCIIPPLTMSPPPGDLPDDVHLSNTVDLINALALDTMQAQDNLLAAKVAQAEFMNHHHTDNVVFTKYKHVLLSTKHHHCKYMHANSHCITKFMPHFDGPFEIACAHPETLSYMLLLPNKPNRFLTFHSSLLRKFNPTNYK